LENQGSLFFNSGKRCDFIGRTQTNTATQQADQSRVNLGYTLNAPICHSLRAL
jgi:hypothetical protein